MESKLEAMLRLHEGVRQFPYRCTAGKMTIGVGFNLDDVGLFPEEIEFILRNRIRLVRTRLERELRFFGSLDEVRQSVLIDMAFNLGVASLLKFRQTLKHIEQGRYGAAAAEMLNSKWARQVKGRATTLSRMMESGEWPRNS
jgi:lysozyme